MSIASALGFSSGKKVRYAIVGAGDIAQEAMMPGVSHTGNSEMTAIVTGDIVKAHALGERYGIEHRYGYDDFARMLADGVADAIYLATPNWRHAEFAIPALQAGLHVLSEKPLEITSEKAQSIVDAAAASSARLMVAYRLHFEPATLDAIRRIRAGELGEVMAFTSAFAQMVDPANHRANSGDLAGPLLDMAPYPINATRYLFEAEPTEVVSAVATRHAAAGFGADVDDTIAVTLRFPGDRIAQFTCSYYANAINSFVVAGTKGSITMDPGYTFGKSLEQYRVIGGKRSHESFKATDQFGGEMAYFSDCILNGRDPEPDGEEGLADLRVIEGIERALASGRAEVLPPFHRSRRIDPDAQERTLRVVSPPEPVNASDPSRNQG
ncbi:Gfo/Idh/MocA family protein [Sphingomonas bacterium]|uniref:Gfo/Idh/MocA family protein n=1 Tax=Sphingomonas bacterium TaxID=1895847 RepID=UPI001576D203|nr:Gfo/Idh/MocA family oxidoreductase [Sphingomonas bacterium]